MSRESVNPIAQACAVALVGLILLGTLVPGSTKEALISPFPGYLHIDKLAHAAGFTGLAIACVQSRLARVRAWHVLVFALALAALTEFCQRFIPGRTAKVSDVAIDFAGACAGVLIASVALRLARQRSGAG